jgi:hypothetical protein
LTTKHEEDQEVEIVERRPVSKESVKRFAARSTKASAQLERREVPAGFVRSPKVEQFLKQRQSRG